MHEGESRDWFSPEASEVVPADEDKSRFLNPKVG